MKKYVASEIYVVALSDWNEIFDKFLLFQTFVIKCTLNHEYSQHQFQTFSANVYASWWCHCENWNKIQNTKSKLVSSTPALSAKEFVVVILTSSINQIAHSIPFPVMSMWRCNSKKFCGARSEVYFSPVSLTVWGRTFVKQDSLLLLRTCFGHFWCWRSIFL